MNKKVFLMLGGFFLFTGVLLTVILLPPVLDSLWEMDWRNQQRLEDYVHEDLRIGFRQGESPMVLQQEEKDRVELWALARMALLEPHGASA